MPNRNLTPDDLKLANELLAGIRERLIKLAGNDPQLLFAYRRKVSKELSYDERGRPGVRGSKWGQQHGKCANCNGISAPPAGGQTCQNAPPRGIAMLMSFPKRLIKSWIASLPRYFGGGHEMEIPSLGQKRIVAGFHIAAGRIISKPLPLSYMGFNRGTRT